MIDKTYLWFGAIVIAIVAIVFGSYLLGWRHSLNNLTIRTATPTQLANAMKNDDFYSTYNENTLLVSGVVSSASKQGSNNVIGLKNTSTYQTLCDLGKTKSPKVGDPVLLVAIGATAQRDTKGVTLKNCSLVGSQ